MKTLNVAVIGVGRMGTNHARVLSEMPGVTLKAVCDANRELAEKASKRFLAERACVDAEAVLEIGDLDAAIIAVPTAEHVAVARKCLERGIHILVEKPMAPTVAECDEIISDSRRCGRVLMVGHVERFNPVILQLKQFLDQKFLGDIYYVETTRAGPFPRRLYGSKDGVVIDLAVHDLDLVAHLFGPLRQLYANHILTPDKHQDIHARVMLKTVSGIGGSSQFSWISPKRERSITVYGDKGIIYGNLNDQEIWYYENGDVDIDYSDNYYQNVLMGRVSEGKVIKFPIKKEEPLKSELGFFCDLMREGKSIDPAYGREAVRYSLSVLQSARKDEIVFLA
jgi:UDP-N-acetylglucosamine 3-dehydrogenase